jgi:uncharacterized protein YndB with AHSA1/START domain
MATITRKPGADYTATITVNAPIKTAFAAVATLEGLRGWWTPETTGSAEPGGKLMFDFPGAAVTTTMMRVEESTEPSRVRWTCLESGLHEWAGTPITFELAEAGPDSTAISFRHGGLNPELECFDMCSAGWNHFLGSLASLAETGTGQPYGS